MIRFTHEIFPNPEQMIFVIEGMRNAYNSWDKSDSHLDSDYGVYRETNPFIYLNLGDNDKELMTKLSKAGSDHRKFMRAMPVMVRITAPLYFWKEFDTYKVGTVGLSCSTMHTIESRPLERSDFSYFWDVDSSSKMAMDVFISEINDLIASFQYPPEGKLKNDIHNQIISMLPDSYNQTRNITMNYEVLKNIYNSRKNHRLKEWRDFCTWIETIPYNWLIVE